MSRHVTYRGTTIDMDTMRRENEKVTAIGNMKVNAKGDEIKGGMVTKTADQIARENHRIQTAIVNTGLKGPVPDAPLADTPVKKTPVKATSTKTKEVEQDNGDIVIEVDKDGS
jgi:hypothetical protein